MPISHLYDFDTRLRLVLQIVVFVRNGHSVVVVIYVILSSSTLAQQPGTGLGLHCESCPSVLFLDLSTSFLCPYHFKLQSTWSRNIIFGLPLFLFPTGVWRHICGPTVSSFNITCSYEVRIFEEAVKFEVVTPAPYTAFLYSSAYVPENFPFTVFFFGLSSFLVSVRILDSWYVL